MKVIGALLLAKLGGNENPTKDDLKKIFESVGAEYEEEKMDLLFSLIKDRDVTELIAAGREKMCVLSSGGPAVDMVVAMVVGAGGDSPSAEEPAAETKKKIEEDKEESAESKDVSSQPAPGTDEQPAEEHEKRRLAMVLIGHAGAGKSTIGGHILCCTGQLNSRQIEKYKEQAQGDGRESLYLADMMHPFDLFGNACFETKSTRFTILDGPVSDEMMVISRLLKADIGVLVISALKGEADRGFHEDFWLPFPASGTIISEAWKNEFKKAILGRTSEHIGFARKLGVSKLIVLLNKMDDVNWEKERYNQIIHDKIVPFLQLAGYNTNTDVVFLPTSGLLGINIDKRVHQNLCSWWTGPSCFEALDSVDVVHKRDPNGPFRMHILDVFDGKNVLTVHGTIVSGSIRVGDRLVVMPNMKCATVVDIRIINVEINDVKIDENEDDFEENFTQGAGPLDHVFVGIDGVERENIHRQLSVLSSIENPVSVVTAFEAEIDLDDYSSESNLTRGELLFNHAMVNFLIEPYNSQSRRPFQCVVKVDTPICVELFVVNPQFGRFALQVRNKVVGFGKVIRI